jgi:hypothetical protein
MKLSQLITALTDWTARSPESIYAELSEPSIQFVDQQDWTWKGIATVLVPETEHRFGAAGCKLLQDVLLATGQQWLVTQLSSGMPLYDPEIQAFLRSLHDSGTVPGAKSVADAVYRMISPLEQNNIATTPEDVAEVHFQLMLVQYKNSKIDYAQDYTQAYREAMTVWDGTPATEPEF